MSELKDFKNNEVYFLIDEDGNKIECYSTMFCYGDKKYACFQIMEGNFNECFLVSIFKINGENKMRLITGEDFKILERVYIYHPYTLDYSPVDIDEQDFIRGYYKV